jgi:uncharacterized protein YegL
VPNSIPVPGGEIARRPLQFFWIADYSGSMAGTKIATLNHAIREAVPAVRAAVASHPEVEIMVRAIKFSDHADWHGGSAAMPIDSYVWPELSTAGGTSTAKALRLLASELTMEKMPPRGFPPVCILISDGFCTDPQAEYDAAIAELNNLPWGKRAVRLAIAIGDAAEYNEKELLKFVTHPEIGLLKADTPQKLVTYIQWASVAGTIGASAAKSKGGGAGPANHNVDLPAPPGPELAFGPADVF